MQKDANNWEKLQNDCENCKKCDLYRTKNNTVFGKGAKNADILFVGEAPGEQEDMQGIPFCGASGKLLDKFFFAADLSQDDYYVANILKCRPPHNRDPHPEEQEACIGHLREQLKLIEPTIIVCLGRIAAMKIIKPDFKITREHGKWFKKGNYYIMAVYHPSALLRDTSKREEMLIDILEIKRMYNEIKSK